MIPGTLPEQIPGTLFVFLVTLVAFLVGEPGVILLLALGCAAGWGGMIESEPSRRRWLLYLALGVWAIAYLYLVWKVFF